MGRSHHTDTTNERKDKMDIQYQSLPPLNLNPLVFYAIISFWDYLLSAMANLVVFMSHAVVL
jgi:hypothetical protein